MTKCASKFLDYKCIPSCGYVPDGYVLDDVIYLVAKYFPLVLITRAELSTVPRNPSMFTTYENRSRIIQEILLRRKSEALQLRKLEIITSAMGKERSDPRHGSLYDSFYSYIAPRKKELQDLYVEGLESSILADLNYNNGRGNTHSDEFHFKYYLRVFEEFDS